MTQGLPSGFVRLYDEDGNPVEVVLRPDGQYALAVQDDRTRKLLEKLVLAVPPTAMSIDNSVADAIPVRVYDAEAEVFASLVADGAQKVSDRMLDIARGAVPGQSGVNKFGRTTNADSADPTDVWDRANVADDQAIWLAPTAARVHALVSSSASDDGDPAGVGAQVVRVWGLTSWDALQSYEDVTLNGDVAPVNTVHSYVIIHRMKAIAFGASGPNVGKITATAAGDATVTAQIEAGEGQTQMAVYGVPSCQAAYVPKFYGSIERDSPTGAGALFRLLWTEDVKSQPAVFTVKHTLSTSVDAAPFSHEYRPYNRFKGPGILKLQVVADAADVYADGGFDVILVKE